jgi:hypothetical protein
MDNIVDDLELKADYDQKEYYHSSSSSSSFSSSSSSSSSSSYHPASVLLAAMQSSQRLPSSSPDAYLRVLLAIGGIDMSSQNPILNKGL